MAKQKTKSKQKFGTGKTADIANQLEHAFLAGLGALTSPQEIGSKNFESLVQKGESFRKKATDRTEELIDDVQDAIREMTDDAQSKASGLLDQVRDASRLEKLNSAFDARVAGAMDRLGVASKRDIDSLNRKMDKVLKALEGGKAPAKKKAAPKRKTKKKVAKKTAKKTTSKRPAKKKVSKRPAKKKAAK
jgi:poly(hydroxyalkanoate) granule-associated protein